MKIFVTGIGAVSAIGSNVKENFNSLINSNSGIAKLKFLDTIHSDNLLFGEFKMSDNEIIDFLELSNKKAYSRTTLLALMAAQEAFSSVVIYPDKSIKTGIVSGTTVGGMDKTELYYDKYLNSDFQNEYIHTHEAADSTEKVAELLGIKDYMTTISTACSSSANAIIFGARLINNGYLDRVIVGGVDALSKFTVNGFNTLMILDNDICKPFDKARKGLNLGEGAAFLVLESEKIVNKYNISPLAEIKGYANTNDAFHQTASSPDGYGAYLAMKTALERANLKPQDISYINAHGTGTPNNDLTEGYAIEKLFGQNPANFSSTKAFTGHTLAAAGALEAVFSVLAINQNVIFPNLFFKDKIEEHNISPTAKLITDKKITNVMSNSFGFGGNDTSLIFSKVE